MRVLITGATGLVGGEILRHLLAAGVHVVMASSTPALRSRNQNLGIIPYDLAREGLSDELAAELARCDAVIHAAAQLPGGALFREAHGPLRVYRLNVGGTAALMDAAARAGIKSFVFLSTANLFPPSQVRVDEGTPVSPPDLYALSKLAGEETAAFYAREAKTSFTCLRISAPYGSGHRTRSVVAAFVENALAGAPLQLMGSGNRRQVFTYVADIARVCLIAMERRRSGVFNITGPASVSMRELAEAVLSAVPGSPSTIVFSGTTDPQEGREREIDISRAREVLGFSPAYGIGAGLKSMVAMIRGPGPPAYAVSAGSS